MIPSSQVAGILGPRVAGRGNAGGRSRAAIEGGAPPRRGPDGGGWHTGSGPVSPDALSFGLLANGLVTALAGAPLALVGGLLAPSPLAGDCLRAGCALLSIAAACLAACRAAARVRPPGPPAAPRPRRPR